MSRKPIATLTLAIAVLVLIAAGALAQGGPPPADAEPGAVGFQGMVLGGLDPVVAPGYRLVLAKSVFEPGDLRHQPHPPRRHHRLRPIRLAWLRLTTRGSNHHSLLWGWHAHPDRAPDSGQRDRPQPARLRLVRPLRGPHRPHRLEPQRRPDRPLGSPPPQDRRALHHLRQRRRTPRP